MEWIAYFLVNSNNLGRVRVGTRHLARDNIQKIVEKLVVSLGDWSPEKRGKACLILDSYISLTENQITGYVNVIIPPLIKILAGDEMYVMENVV